MVQVWRHQSPPSILDSTSQLQDHDDGRTSIIYADTAVLDSPPPPLNRFLNCCSDDLSRVTHSDCNLSEYSFRRGGTNCQHIVEVLVCDAVHDTIGRRPMHYNISPNRESVACAALQHHTSGHQATVRERK